MKGVIHEKWNIAQLVSGSRIQLSSFYTGTANVISIPADVIIQVTEVQHFHDVDDIIPNDGHQRLYLPSDPNFPCWDAIYDDGTTTMFLQFSIFHLDGGHDASITASFGTQDQAGKWHSIIHSKISFLQIRGKQPTEKSQSRKKQASMHKL